MRMVVGVVVDGEGCVNVDGFNVDEFDSGVDDVVDAMSRSHGICN